MRDGAFKSLLTQDVALDRGVANVSSDGAVAAPKYERYVDETRARIMPLHESQYESVLGERGDLTHRAYLESIHDVQQGDLMVWKTAKTSIMEEAEAGASEILVTEPTALHVGQTVEIGHVIEGEEHVEVSGEYETAIVAGVNVEIISLKKPLTEKHLELSPVTVVRRFEVVNVRRWPGMEHHIEAALKELRI